MSYETVVEQVRALPESCLEDASRYMQFLLDNSGRDRMDFLSESDKEFEERMENGLSDIASGRTKPLKEAFDAAKRQFA